MALIDNKKRNDTLMVRTDHLIYEYVRFDIEDSNSANKSTESEVKVKALDGIDVEIPKECFVTILGHNGSGKSTLARHFNALLEPTGGSVWIKGMDTREEENTWNIRQTAGMVFQNPDNQIIATIVEEDVAFGPENLGIPTEEIRKRVNEALESVKMSEYANSTSHFLSGGQKQRLAIAGVLAMKPDCIILDEPTAMLDPSGRAEVLSSVMKLNKEEAKTIILITHYMEEAVKSDRVIVMDNGKIVMDATPREVFVQVEKMKKLGLDVPQVTEFTYELNKNGFNLPKDILNVNEMVDAIIERGFKKDAPMIRDKEIVVENLSDEICFEIKNLTHTYSPETAFEKKALDDINITIKKGSFVGLIGHTGSGKSTLIQHLNALMKPTSGQILLFGEDINADKSKLKSIRQKVGLVFQYPEHQLFEVTIAKDVAFGPENMNLDKQEVQKRVKESLGLVGISEDLFENSPFDLSGGQKRRVAIAGVLAMKPDVLILDEPTAGLDPRGREEILSNIKKMHETLGITVILVSHRMEDIALYADSVIVMHESKIAMQGTCAQIFNKGEELEKIGLAAPQISKFVSNLKEKGYNLPNDIYTVERAVEVFSDIVEH